MWTKSVDNTRVFYNYKKDQRFYMTIYWWKSSIVIGNIMFTLLLLIFIFRVCIIVRYPCISLHVPSSNLPVYLITMGERTRPHRFTGTGTNNSAARYGIQYQTGNQFAHSLEVRKPIRYHPFEGLRIIIRITLFLSDRRKLHDTSKRYNLLLKVGYQRQTMSQT